MVQKSASFYFHLALYIFILLFSVEREKRNSQKLVELLNQLRRIFPVVLSFVLFILASRKLKLKIGRLLPFNFCSNIVFG
jgi:hypothetical protein